VPIYEYAAKVQPWGQKLGRNVKGHVWVPAPDEALAEQRVYDNLADLYGYVPGQDIVSIQLSLIEDDDGMESEVNKNVVL
jgi:hypothetical protein